MKNTKKESNKSKNQKKRKEGKHKNRSIETKLSRGPLFFVFCPVETTSVRLLRSVTHNNNNNNNNNNNTRIKSTQHARAYCFRLSNKNGEQR
jgi:hypothetical protein